MIQYVLQNIFVHLDIIKLAILCSVKRFVAPKSKGIRRILLINHTHQFVFFQTNRKFS